MKILMILENFFPPDERVENEISQLTENNHFVTLLCYSKSGNYGIEENGNLKIIRFPIHWLILKSSALALLIPIYFRYWKKNIKKVLSNESFQFIHVHDLPLIKVVYEISKELNIPFVADLHENRPEIMKFYHHTNTIMGRILISRIKWENYQKEYSPKATNLILVTNEAKKFYAENYNIESHKITVLPNYIDWMRFNKFPINPKAKPEYEKYFTIVYFGDTGLRRGTLTILQAAKELLSNSEIHFLIIGSSREQNILKSEIAKQRLNNVTLTGWIGVGEALNYVAVSKIGLCPFLRNVHHDTTFANKMFQYMALHKPVIVSDCTSQSDFVTNEDVGLVFKSGDYRDLADKILKLREMALYTKLSINAFNCVKNKYNWQISGKSLLNIYSQEK